MRSVYDFVPEQVEVGEQKSNRHETHESSKYDFEAYGLHQTPDVPTRLAPASKKTSPPPPSI